jgi:protein-export membrane protein SecD
VSITLALYKLIPVTLSTAGIAGFIISIGMAVDANILIFERFKEERRLGHGVRDAIEAGFKKAWLSIRDANTASIIIAIILFWFGSSLIKGFALTFGLGVIVSLISAIGITRVFLRALPIMENSKVGRFLFSNGFIK